MIKSDALVSIIVPVYGTEKYLPACIESICNQSYSNLQIILVDDQSPDKCPEICDDFAQKDNRIMVIHQKNMGVSGARNTGIRNAIGKYIMFVDSDDELYPAAVEILLQNALIYNADIALSYQEYAEDNNKDIGNEYVFYQDTEALLLSLGSGKNMDAVWGKLFRTEFIADIYFEEGKDVNEDGFFLFLCCLKRPMIVRHNVLVYQYNVRPGSISRQAFSEKYLSMLYFCEQKKQLINAQYPQYMEQAYNMEVRTNLQFLDVLCRTTDKKYKKLQKESIQKVRKLYQYHKPMNNHHKKLAWIVKLGLYPIYKSAVRFKYYR